MASIDGLRLSNASNVCTGCVTCNCDAVYNYGDDRYAYATTAMIDSAASSTAVRSDSYDARTPTGYPCDARRRCT